MKSYQAFPMILLASTLGAASQAAAATWSCSAYCHNKHSSNRYDKIVSTTNADPGVAMQVLQTQCDGELHGGQVTIGISDGAGGTTALTADALPLIKDACVKLD